MTGVEKVVTEMTRSFRHQVQSKEVEVRGERERCRGLEESNRDLEERCRELDTAVKVSTSILTTIPTTIINITTILQEIREKLSRLEVDAGSQGEEAELRLSHGSVEDLSRLVQQELELSSQLDNSLLSQVASLDTSSASGMSEVQRLLRKIQSDGIKVLSLSCTI